MRGMAGGESRMNHPSVYAGRPPRVLLEMRNGGEAFARLRLLQTAGYEVSWCPGPEGHPVRRCPLMNGDVCPLVESADVLVCALGLDQQSGREVLDALHRTRPELPVVVETTASQAERWEPLVAHHRVVNAPTSAKDLVTAVNQAMAALVPADLRDSTQPEG